MLTFPGETPPKKPMFHAFSLAQESEIFSSEIEASGYSNAQLKEFIEKIYDCLKKYASLGTFDFSLSTNSASSHRR